MNDPVITADGARTTADGGAQNSRDGFDTTAAPLVRVTNDEPSTEGGDHHKKATPTPTPSPPPPEFVGLINQGCTCYLNSMLQLFFHLSYFRAAVYKMCTGKEDPSPIPYALQELFSKCRSVTHLQAQLG